MSEESDQAPDSGQRSRRGLSAWQVIKSTLAAAFGVQTPEARERDFSHGSPLPFIVAGVVFTAVFVIALVVVVNLVLATAQP